MPRRTKKLPSLRHHRPSSRAVVTLGGRDHYLGAWGSSEAQAAYDALIAEWLASGRGRPKTDGGQTATDPTIVEVLVTYLDHAEKHYSAEPGERSSELMNMKEAIKPLRKL